MANIANTLTELWKPPRLRSGKKERHATWLELFFDLVLFLQLQNSAA
ncbi:MAG: hypothetical protein N2D54_06950 [Chloroflexota bacterium]